MIPNDLARNASLSNQAFRIAIILRSHAAGWQTSANSLAQELKWSRTTSSRAIDELVDAGLLAICKFETAEGKPAYREYHVPISVPFTPAEMTEFNRTVRLPSRGVSDLGNAMYSLAASGCLDSGRPDGLEEYIKEDQLEDHPEEQSEHQCIGCCEPFVGEGIICSGCQPGGDAVGKGDSDILHCWKCETDGANQCPDHRRTSRLPARATSGSLE